MTKHLRLRRIVWLVLALATAAVGLAVWQRFQHDVERARVRAAQGGVVVETRCGAIEYQEAGRGVPLLVVHGSGGGHDQGMAFASALARQGVRVIAMSRFGYLRTPMPADTSPPAQAYAHACLLDALGIRQAAVLGLSGARFIGYERGGHALVGHNEDMLQHVAQLLATKRTEP